MKLETSDLISEYYEKVKHLYPGVNSEEFKMCCSLPFSFVKQEMESGELKTVRLKYFGTFLVYPMRVQSMLNKMKLDFKDLKIDSKIYFSYKSMLESYLEKHKNNSDEKNK